MSETTKQKLSDSLGKSIYCIELNKTWKRIRECAKELNLDESNISKVCRGKYKQLKGYHFKYL